MTALSETALDGRVHSISMRSIFHNGTEKYDMLAVTWVDQNRRYFVLTVGKTTPSDEQVRIHWRKRDRVLEQESQVVTIPSLMNDYYSCAGMIDRHNRVRQDDLALEKSFEVKEWSMRVNSSLLGMFVTDTYLLYRGGFGSAPRKHGLDFFYALAEKLIDNTYDVT